MHAEHDRPAAERLVLEIGRALHRYGTPAHRLESMLGTVAEAVGLEAQFFCLPTSITAAFGPLGEQSSGFVRVEPGGVDLGKLTRLYVCLRALRTGKIDAAGALVPMVPGVLLLVPGSIGFRSVAGLLRGETVTAVDAAFDMVIVAVALAVGLLVANVVLPPRRAL